MAGNEPSGRWGQNCASRWVGSKFDADLQPHDAFAKLSRYESTLLREVERLRRMLKEERGPYNDTGRFAGGLNVTPQEEGKALSRMLHAGKQKPTRRPPRT